MDDSVVALLVLDAEQRGLFQSPIDKTNWSQYMTSDAFAQEQWLLSYEANVKGFMPAGEEEIMLVQIHPFLI